MDWVLVDTLIWASFFSKPNSPEKHAVDDLIDADRGVLVGPIVTEVLLGFRRKEQADWIASHLRLAHYPDASFAHVQLGRYTGTSILLVGEG